MADQFDAPIPGQSMTSDPENPMPFETSPNHTDKNELTQVMFDQLTTPDSIEQISQLLQDGASVEAMTKIILFTGMSKGQYNTDMQLLMVEPVIYIILFIADRLGIQPIMEEDEYLDTSLEDEINDIMGTTDIEQLKEKVPTSLLSKLDKTPIGEEIPNGTK